jgi:putative Mn2+ efflux pump MntP
MTFDFLFFLNSILFGAGLATDAFSVSVANGMNEPVMKRSRVLAIAGTFGLFQMIMPLLGWLCVRSVAEAFSAFQKFIPWIALALLLLIGIKMIFEGIRPDDGEHVDPVEREKTEPKKNLKGGTLILQGIATSIDALSVGFAIAEYKPALAVTESLIIGAVTFGLCILGVRLGGRIGAKLAEKATIVGGVILIIIGIEIFVTGII